MYEIAENLIQSQTFTSHLGIKITRLDKDKAQLMLPYKPFLGEERVNGGAIASLIDFASPLRAQGNVLTCLYVSFLLHRCQ